MEVSGRGLFNPLKPDLNDTDQYKLSSYLK
jgi:hypothetical protein